ncbi:copper amine oxidase N-terminal domain-containing protein [Paenibacillus sp. FSL R7-0312]|uniref:copper amine oxidase N-terminal domain-containing protein n=1 Tax=Paenibacillus sp. FSL R7-0312 TaxID=2921682 RepID=UPI0030F8C2EB
MNLKKLFAASVALSLIISVPQKIYANSDLNENNIIKLQIGSSVGEINNSTKFKLDYAPYIKNNSTMVPLRFISENLNANVKWNQEKQEVTIDKNGKTIVLVINSKNIIVNDKPSILENPPTVSKNMTFVPLRFISENLNAEVIWNQTDKSIIIKSQGATIEDNASNYTEEDQIKEILALNTKYFNDRDAVKFLTTFSAPKETVAQLKTYFETQSVIYIVDDVKDIKITNKKATALFTRITEISYVSNDVTYTTMKQKVYFDATLDKVNGEWKINQLKYIKMEDLLAENPS